MDTIELTTTVLPGGKLVLEDPRLHEGDNMQVLLRRVPGVLPAGDDPMDAVVGHQW